MSRLELSDWNPVRTDQLIGVVALAAIMLGLLVAGDPGWTPIFDDANLAFHEAGHLGFRLFGSTAALYGGVLGQLTFPLAAAAIFFWKRQAHATAGAALWGLQNLFNIARYMADARAQELPLVGGDEHDFWNIFARWDVLAHDTTIAAVTRTIAWLGFAAVLGWLAWRWRREAADRARPAADRARPSG